MFQKFKTAQVTLGPISLGLPKVATLVLALIGGVAQVINGTLISTHTSTHKFIALGIYFLVAAGIPPLVGSAFRGALHLPVKVFWVVQAALGTILMAMSSVTMGHTLYWILAAVVTVAGELGFSASVEPVPTPTPPAA